MPLSPPVPRRVLHTRRLEMRGYAREDGLFDIEAHLVDDKSSDFTVVAGPTVPAGVPVHEMWVRLTIDHHFTVHAAEAATDAAPFGACRGGPATLQRLVGLRIGGGWGREVAQRLAGAQGCTHLTAMLVPLGAVGFQSLVLPLRTLLPPPDPTERPALLDSCLAMASDGEVAAVRWPLHHGRRRRTD